MVYPNRHLYFTFHWRYSNIEEGQCGLRFDRATMPDETERLAASNAVSAWWVQPGASISSQYLLTFVKFALIDPDGKYPPEEPSQQIDFAPEVAGLAGNNIFPLQTSHVISLTTAALRGRAHRGRIYAPPLNDAISSGTASWSGTDVDARLTQTVTMLNALETGLNAPLMVFSRVGTGTKRQVTGIAGGIRPDVQRRRAADQPEVYRTQSL